MNKLIKNNFSIVIVTTLLTGLFIVLSFFIFIILKSDIIDIKLNRIDTIILLKDLVVFIFWLCLIPAILFCIKQYKKDTTK